MSIQNLEQLFEQNKGVLERQQVIDAGLRPHLLSQWVEEGRAERLQKGIYRAIDSEDIEHETLVELSLKIPNAIVCIHSALNFHDLGTVIPSAVQLAIPNHSWAPKFEYPPVDYYYYSDNQYNYGVESHAISGRTVKVHSPEKAIVDSFYYRKKLGKDVFLEALKDYLQGANRSIPKLIDAAKVRRVTKTITPYLEALA